MCQWCVSAIEAVCGENREAHCVNSFVELSVLLDAASESLSSSEAHELVSSGQATMATVINALATGMVNVCHACRVNLLSKFERICNLYRLKLSELWVQP